MVVFPPPSVGSKFFLVKGKQALGTSGKTTSGKRCKSNRGDDGDGPPADVSHETLCKSVGIEKFGHCTRSRSQAWWNADAISKQNTQIVIK